MKNALNAFGILVLVGITVAAWSFSRVVEAKPNGRPAMWLLEVKDRGLEYTVPVTEGVAFTLGGTQCAVAAVGKDEHGSWTHLRCGDSMMETNCQRTGRAGAVHYARISFKESSASLLCSE